MLGFDYLGQTYLASIPIGEYIVSVFEKLDASDKLITSAQMFFHENIELGETVTVIGTVLIQAIERLNISDNLKLDFVIVVYEGIVLYTQLIAPLVAFALKEIAEIGDKLVYIGTIVIREIFHMLGLLKINGKEIYVFWEACYHKVEAVVENMYKKFRR